jgi:hypothetical protein
MTPKLKYSELFAKFKEQNPIMALMVREYRPSMKKNCIRIWLKNGKKCCIVYQEKLDTFITAPIEEAE